MSLRLSLPPGTSHGTQGLSLATDTLAGLREEETGALRPPQPLCLHFSVWRPLAERMEKYFKRKKKERVEGKVDETQETLSVHAS